MKVDYGAFTDFSIRQKIIFGLVLVTKDETKFVGMQLLNKFSSVHRTQPPAVVMSESDFFPKAIIDEIGGQRMEVDAKEWLDVEVEKLKEAAKMLQLLEGVVQTPKVDSEDIAGIKDITLTSVKIQPKKKPRLNAIDRLYGRV